MRLVEELMELFYVFFFFLQPPQQQAGSLAYVSVSSNILADSVTQRFLVCTFTFHRGTK